MKWRKRRKRIISFFLLQCCFPFSKQSTQNHIVPAVQELLLVTYEPCTLFISYITGVAGNHCKFCGLFIAGRVLERYNRLLHDRLSQSHVSVSQHSVMGSEERLPCPVFGMQFWSLSHNPSGFAIENRRLSTKALILSVSSSTGCNPLMLPPNVCNLCAFCVCFSVRHQPFREGRGYVSLFFSFSTTRSNPGGKRCWRQFCRDLSPICDEFQIPLSHKIESIKSAAQPLPRHFSLRTSAPLSFIISHDLNPLVQPRVWDGEIIYGRDLDKEEMTPALPGMTSDGTSLLCKSAHSKQGSRITVQAWHQAVWDISEMYPVIS